jgi:4-amino-4-deoxy-L-arabinose transferase-like glycosyltransferase
MAKRKQKVLTQEKKKPHSADPGLVPRYNKDSYSWMVISIVILFVTIVRLRLLGLPLERDEGEYAYMGQLLLNGFAPFTHAYNMKFPGTSLMYAFFMLIFGESPQAIHLALLLINVSTIILLFIMARRYLGSRVAVIGAASYALFSVRLMPRIL